MLHLNRLCQPLGAFLHFQTNQRHKLPQVINWSVWAAWEDLLRFDVPEDNKMTQGDTPSVGSWREQPSDGEDGKAGTHHQGCPRQRDVYDVLGAKGVTGWHPEALCTLPTWIAASYYKNHEPRALQFCIPSPHTPIGRETPAPGMLRAAPRAVCVTGDIHCTIIPCKFLSLLLWLSKMQKTRSQRED